MLRKTAHDLSVGDGEENAGLRGPAALKPTSCCFDISVARMFSGPEFLKIDVTCQVVGLWHPVFGSSIILDVSMGVVLRWDI